MKILEMADLVRFRTMTTAELRETFLIDDLFQAGRIEMRYVDLDRTVIGSAVPTAKPLKLETDYALKANYFLERRELGVLNVGGAGTVTVGGGETVTVGSAKVVAVGGAEVVTVGGAKVVAVGGAEVVTVGQTEAVNVGVKTFLLGKLDALYVGRGNEEVLFASANAEEPAEFYLLSYPAHAVWPTTLMKAAGQGKTPLGKAENANLREITKLIHLEGTRSCQLVMGFTQLAPGSVWNTMPAHTHMRRSEVYFYFDIPTDQRVIHLMGPGQETRNIVVANRQVVVSPGWSIHAGVGTSNYTFCWGMGGENQVYSDMDALAIAELL
jgi:4-deoxy-L-threo-5-hexosulose-uronate ketol-isomerase